MAQESNPFYISPGVADVAPLMQGIGSLIKENRAERKKKDNADALMEAYEAGDSDSVAKLIAHNPELKDSIGSMMNFRDDRTKKNWGETVRSLAANPESAQEILVDRMRFVNNNKGIPNKSTRLLNQFNNDREGFNKSLLMAAASEMNKQEFDALKSSLGMGAVNLDAEKLRLERDKFNQKTGIDKRIQNRKDEELKLDELKNKQAIETNKQVMAKRELEIEKLTSGITQKKSDIKAGFQSSLATSDSTLGYIDKLLEHPGLNKAVGVDSAFFTAPGSDAANFEALLESFDAKLFSTAIKQMVGMGSLSDAEGKKISASVGALTPKMSNEAFRTSLNDIKKEMSAARQRTVDRMNPEDKPAGSEDSEAVAWAKANPDDPRAAQIMQSQGAQ